MKYVLFWAATVTIMVLGYRAYVYHNATWYERGLACLSYAGNVSDHYVCLRENVPWGN